MGQGHLKIGDLALACGVSDQAVRLYERKGLLEPVGRTAKGYRLYDSGSVETLRFIKQAQRSGFILEEIKLLLHADIQNEDACTSMKRMLDRKIHALAERMLELQETKNVLQSLRQACDGEPGPVCPAFLKLCAPHVTASNSIEALPVGEPISAASCPACGVEGRAVKPVTLRSLLQPHLHLQVEDEVYHFCANPDCALVYYNANDTQTFVRGDLAVRVGVKERCAPRPLCYCFGHSAESIREEWVRTGKSTVLDSIKAEVKAGNCHCEVTNPSGGCCLGDIAKELKALRADSELPIHDCCASPKTTRG